jgi:hypothetical protein
MNLMFFQGVCSRGARQINRRRKKEMKRRSLSCVIVFGLVLIPLWGVAGTIEGTIQGFTCVTTGTVCPVGKEDPMIAAERVFVVLEKGGKDYHFVPNIDRAILARHINRIVRVTGKIDEKYRSINAQKFEVQKNGGWEETWSRKMQEDLLEEMQRRTVGSAP